MLTVTSVMMKHTKRQVRYYKSRLYHAFVISDVCNRSLRVVPFKTEIARNQEHLRYCPNIPPIYLLEVL